MQPTEPIPLYPERNGHEPSPFRREGLGYVYEPPGVGVRFHVDHLSGTASDGLRARVKVVSQRPGRPGGVVYRSRHLLEGSRSLSDLRKALEEIDEDVPWGNLVRQLAAAVVDAEEAGTPFIHVRDLPRRQQATDLVQYLVQAGRTNSLYGPGGYGKGYLAVAMSVAVALGRPFAGLQVTQGTVMYADFEDDPETFRERLERVCRGLESPVDPDTVPLYYRRCERALPDEVEWLSAEVDRLGAVLMVTDSVEMASPSGDHRNYNDRATDMQRGLRCIHCSHLLIDHVSDQGRREKGLAGKAINGIMKGNLARNTWEIKRDQEMGATLSQVGLYQTKTNHTGQLLPLGFRLDFSEPDTVRITRADNRQSDILSEPLALSYRLRGALRERAKLVHELASELNAKEDSIYRTLKRMESRGEVKEWTQGERGRGHGGLWGLLAL